MSKAGASNKTGITWEQKVGLYYLLKHIDKENFQHIKFDSDNFEDFTLVYTNNIIDYEVKGHHKKMDFSDIRTIIKNVINKSKNDDSNYQFNIVVKQLNDNFRENYLALKKYGSNSDDELYTWVEKVFQKDYKRNWSKEEIFFLENVKEIRELENKQTLESQINRLLKIRFPYYLEGRFNNLIINNLYQVVLEKGSKGGYIKQCEFYEMVVDEINNQAEYSESFCPTLSIEKKVHKIDSYLKSEGEFKRLNDKKFLTALTAPTNSKIIQYIYYQLLKNNFELASCQFFIEKALFSKSNILSAFYLIEEKRKRGLSTDKYIINFICDTYTEYSSLRETIDGYYSPLKLLRKIANEDKGKQFATKIMEFIISFGLIPIEKYGWFGIEKERERWVNDSEVGEIFAEYCENIDLIFSYYAIGRSNHYQPPKNIYSLIIKFIQKNRHDNFDYIVNKIEKQGYDYQVWNVKSEYNRGVSEIGYVEHLFRPLFSEYYKANKADGWKYVKQKIIDNDDVPAYLIRSIIPILISRIEDSNLSSNERNIAFEYLKAQFSSKKRTIIEIPESIFNELYEKKNFNDFGEQRVLELIKLQTTRYQGYFHYSELMLITLIRLTNLNYTPAVDFLKQLIGNANLVQSEFGEKILELLGKYGEIAQNVKLYSDFFVEGINNSIKLPYDSLLLSKICCFDSNLGTEIVQLLLKKYNESYEVLQYLAGIFFLLRENPKIIFKVFQQQLKSKTIFKNTFKNNEYIRRCFAELVGELAKKSLFTEAKTIIKYSIDDIGSEHVEKSTPYQKDVINTEWEGVRGAVARSLGYFIYSKNADLIKYAYEKLNFILDLNNQLTSEPNYYVRYPVLKEFYDLMHHKHLSALEIAGYNLTASFRQLPFQIIDKIEVDRNTNPDSKIISKNLYQSLSLFTITTYFDTDESLKALQIIKKYADKNFEDNTINLLAELYAVMLVYYAVQREYDFTDIKFNPKVFKNKLLALCKINNPYKIYLVKEFEKRAYFEYRYRWEDFEKIEEYWKLIIEEYDSEIYKRFYEIMGSILHASINGVRYPEYIHLLKQVVDKELNENSKVIFDSSMNGIMGQCYHINVEDFLYFLDLILKESVKKGEKIYDSRSMNTKWIQLFKKMDSPSKTDSIFDIYNSISENFEKLEGEDNFWLRVAAHRSE